MFAFVPRANINLLPISLSDNIKGVYVEIYSRDDDDVI